MGLQISRQLVEKMAGSLIVTSEVGKGSTFAFNVRFGLAARIERSVVIGVEDLKGRRVLVIDDNATNRFIMRETLNAWGPPRLVFVNPPEMSLNSRP